MNMGNGDTIPNVENNVSNDTDNIDYSTQQNYSTHNKGPWSFGICSKR